MDLKKEVDEKELRSSNECKKNIWIDITFEIIEFCIDGFSLSVPLKILEFLIKSLLGNKKTYGNKNEEKQEDKKIINEYIKEKYFLFNVDDKYKNESIAIYKAKDSSEIVRFVDSDETFKIEEIYVFSEDLMHNKTYYCNNIHCRIPCYNVRGRILNSDLWIEMECLHLVKRYI